MILWKYYTFHPQEITYIWQSLNGELYSIPQLIKKEEYKIKDETVGIIFPNYYMTVPDIIKEYLEKVEIIADYIFTICSYGSIEEGERRALKKNIIKF